MSAVINGIVQFDWNYFLLRYPEIATSLNPQLGQIYFNEAQLYCDNTPCSIVLDASVGGQRYMFLHMLTAHVAFLNARLNGQPSSPLVGRINNGTQGSVSVQSTMKDPTAGSEDWFAQTKYGAAYWAASAVYRTMHYARGPQRSVEPYPWSQGDLFDGYGF